MSEVPEDLQQMTERIEKEKRKKRYTSSERNTNNSNSSPIMAFQVTVELISGVLVGAGIGYILDEIFDFHSILLLIFIILGSIAGMLNVYRYIKNSEDREERK